MKDNNLKKMEKEFTNTNKLTERDLGVREDLKKFTPIKTFKSREHDYCSEKVMSKINETPILVPEDWGKVTLNEIQIKILDEEYSRFKEHVESGSVDLEYFMSHIDIGKEYRTTEKLELVTQLFLERINSLLNTEYVDKYIIYDRDGYIQVLPMRESDLKLRDLKFSEVVKIDKFKKVGDSYEYYINYDEFMGFTIVKAIMTESENDTVNIEYTDKYVSGDGRDEAQECTDDRYLRCIKDSLMRIINTN